MADQREQSARRSFLWGVLVGMHLLLFTRSIVRWICE